MMQRAVQSPKKQTFALRQRSVSGKAPRELLVKNGPQAFWTVPAAPRVCRPI